MSFDTVYVFDLHSITPNIRVNKDWSKKDNIKVVDTKIVSTVMVQKTLNPNLYKEIMTGIKIPAYRIIKNELEEIYYKSPKKPVFIIIKEENDFIKYSNDLKRATAEEVREYIREHTNDNFKDKLHNIFKTAEEYYKESSLKNNYSDKEKIKKMLKSLR